MRKFFYLRGIILLMSLNIMAQIDHYDRTDPFEITGPFQVDNGGEMTVIMQSCPAPER